jgi:uncharacterized protein with GYD domain
LCSEARFTSTAGRLWGGREAAIAKVLQNAGGKLLAYYLTFGEDDFLLIADCPDNDAALSVAIVGAAGGSISNLKTTVAVTSKEAMAAFKTARSGEGIQERRALTRFATAALAVVARPAL